MHQKFIFSFILGLICSTLFLQVPVYSEAAEEKAKKGKDELIALHETFEKKKNRCWECHKIPMRERNEFSVTHAEGEKVTDYMHDNNKNCPVCHQHVYTWIKYDILGDGEKPVSNTKEGEEVMLSWGELVSEGSEYKYSAELLEKWEATLVKLKKVKDLPKPWTSQLKEGDAFHIMRKGRPDPVIKAVLKFFPPIEMTKEEVERRVRAGDFIDRALENQIKSGEIKLDEEGKIKTIMASIIESGKVKISEKNGPRRILFSLDDEFGKAMESPITENALDNPILTELFQSGRIEPGGAKAETGFAEYLIEDVSRSMVPLTKEQKAKGEKPRVIRKIVVDPNMEGYMYQGDAAAGIDSEW